MGIEQAQHAPQEIVDRDAIAGEDLRAHSGAFQQMGLEYEGDLDYYRERLRAERSNNAEIATPNV